MKTVYTLTAAQMAVLQRIEKHLHRDPSNALGVVLRKGCASDLTFLIDAVADTSTVQYDAADRKGWAGTIDRRVVDRRNTDAGPIIRNVAAAIRTGEQA